MLYRVTYQETLFRTFVVDAEDMSDARDKISEAVECDDVVLDANDYCDYDFWAEEADEGDEKYYQNLADVHEFESDDDDDDDDDDWDED